MISWTTRKRTIKERSSFSRALRSKKKKKAALLLFQLKNPSGIEGVELLLRKTCRAERRKCFCMINGHEGPFLAQLLLLLYSQAAERVNLSK